MVRQANYARPVQLSLKVLRDAHIDSFPVSLKQILRTYSIRLMTYTEYCRYNDCDISVCFDQFGKDGATITQNRKYLIVYNNRQEIKNRVRFTLAHELGHIFHRHHDELGVGTLRRLWVEKSLYDVMEDESNCFARNLLCPALAVQEVLRMHGFVASNYDAVQKRTVWLKVPAAPCLPELPPNLTDSFLVQQSFMVTPSAAKIRCSFLKEDLRNTPISVARPIISCFTYTAQWRCGKCGALRVNGAEYCFNCGAKRRYRFMTAESYIPCPTKLSYVHRHFSFCPTCGNAEIPEEAIYCPVCGHFLANPCIPNKVRNRDITHLLELVDMGSVHLNPPGMKYCPICGAETLFAALGEPKYNSFCDVSDSLITQDVKGITPVKYGPSIPYEQDNNGNYKVKKCPRCLNEDIEYDAEYCIICGLSLTNVCDGKEDEHYDEIYYHTNPPHARFCCQCGAPTAYSRLSILPSYQSVLSKMKESASLQEEIFTSGIEEDAFWELQDEISTEFVAENATAFPTDEDDEDLPF